MTAASTENQPNANPLTLSAQIVSGLGAAGVAMQNYPAVVLFMQDLVKHMPALHTSSALLHSTAFITGGLASGMVNYWMNLELMDDFYKRITSNKAPQYIRYKLNTWQKFQYFGGIFVFVVTGILFGLMAFTFALTGPLAVLSNAVGLLVASIMTIQEVETWLKSYDDKYENDENENPVAPPLTMAQLIGKYCGHVIAAGNVLALSLLFTLSLTQFLMTLHMAAFPALMIGLTVAFTFGAFTEYFFYNAYLSDFGKDFAKKWEAMLTIPPLYLAFGILCMSTNALVNAALTYAGVHLLSGLLVAASITLPPVAAITVVAAISAFFAGSASLILGTALWIRTYAKKPEAQPPQSIPASVVPLSMYRPASNAEHVHGSLQSSSSNGVAGDSYRLGSSAK